MKTYRVEVSYCFGGPKTWIEVQETSMTFARAATRRGTLVPGTRNRPGYYEGGCYDTHRVVEVQS